MQTCHGQKQITASHEFLHREALMLCGEQKAIMANFNAPGGDHGAIINLWSLGVKAAMISGIRQSLVDGF